LIYSRFWNKFLFDLGVVCRDEPFRKLVNQGMIQGRSNFVYRVKGTQTYVSYNLRGQYDVAPIRVDVNLVSDDVLDTEAFRRWMPEFAEAEFVLENGKYICGWEVEKMSKSMYNVVNPDKIVEQYGADTLRMYEMFLGPLEASKPWDTHGIEGVHKFLRRLWRTAVGTQNQLLLAHEPATEDELRILHKTIKKITDDVERFSFNTAVSAFMIALNELTALKCQKVSIFEPLVVVVQPFAPHIAEELWARLGHPEGSLSDARWPECNEVYLHVHTLTYPVSFNGKRRYEIEVPADAPHDMVQQLAMAHELAPKYLEGKTPKKVIVVPGRIVNVVL
jgi:leucyl-tRNA synthetase